VIDTHDDVTLRIIDEPEFDLGRRASDGHTDLVRMREGGLDAEFLAVWPNPRLYQGEKAWERTLAMIDAVEAAAARNADVARLARTAADVRAAAAEGKVALLVGVEGAHALGAIERDEQALDRIRTLDDRGVRYLTLTWMNSNVLGGSSGDGGRTKGLTPLGHKAVRLMNDLGMIVDVSHVSDPTFFDAVAESRLPVIASHSGARALHDHPRNVSDDMLRAIATNDGAVCIVFYPGFLDAVWAENHRTARRTSKTPDVEQLPLSRLADHIDHAVKVAGIDHVCLGSDFDGIGALPAGLEDVSKLPALTAELARRGYSPEDITKVLGANVLRVLEANENGRVSPDR
jgi:membrane dipeptidase